VHIWSLPPGEPRQVATLGAESDPYDPDRPWDDRLRIPSATWHPQQPILAALAGGALRTWSPSGPADLPSWTADAEYRWLAFSPDGRTLWASPSAQAGGDDPWGSADALAFSSGARRTGLPAWDTGVATHPGGDLVLTLLSDQGATLGLFARIEQAGDHATMRLLTRALILDADGYETPVFSPDGRFLAIRGNAYENSLQVFAFPSLREVMATTLGSPYPGYPASDQWLAEYRSWSRHNIAFATRPAARLLFGTPDGRILELDVESGASAEHAVPRGQGVAALTVTAEGDALVATEGGEVHLLRSIGGGPGEAADRSTATTVAASFLGSATEVPTGVSVEDALETTDGRRTWNPGELDGVTEASEADPTWLRMRAAVNSLMRGRS
jgi:WD40 repeat protein